MKPVTIAIVATVAAVAVVYAAKRAFQAAADAGPLGIGAAVGSGVVNAGAGVVLGMGDAIGIPRTEMNECERAMAEGRTWDASFACPAPVFLRYLAS
jgi:hypothetical protein